MGSRNREKGASHMTIGTVKFYNSSKGFGFVTPDEGGKDAFVHVSALERSGMTGLADGQRISFDMERGRDGRESAVNIRAA
jgi:CspA family cold shock protein